jgi:hypothetical protein
MTPGSCFFNGLTASFAVFKSPLVIASSASKRFSDLRNLAAQFPSANRFEHSLNANIERDGIRHGSNP